MLDTLSNVKARLGITTSDDDTFLTQQITLLSDVIEAYCGRKFISDDYSQTFYRDDYGTSEMIELYHFPVSVVTSVTEDAALVSNTLYRLHKPTGRIIGDGKTFFCAKATVVLYTAGYATCPSPVLSVLDSLVSERYSKKKSGIDLNFGSDVQRVSIPGAISLDFDYSLSNNERKSAYGSILGSHVNVLDSWRSERAVHGSSKLEYVEEVP